MLAWSRSPRRCHDLQQRREGGTLAGDRFWSWRHETRSLISDCIMRVLHRALSRDSAAKKV